MSRRQKIRRATIIEVKALLQTKGLLSGALLSALNELAESRPLFKRPATADQAVLSYYIYDGRPGSGGTRWMLPSNAPDISGMALVPAIVVLERFVYDTIHAGDYEAGAAVTYVIYPDDGNDQQRYRQTFVVNEYDQTEIDEMIDAALMRANPHYQDDGIGQYDYGGITGTDVQQRFYCEPVIVHLPIPPPTTWVWEAPFDEGAPRPRSRNEPRIDRITLTLESAVPDLGGTSYEATYKAEVT